MVELRLNGEEAEVLREVLKSYLSGLQDEIAHTDDHDVREKLRHSRAVVEALQQRVSAPA
jgi:iron uptake system EfeUOB component EfeO/EfeM